MTESSKTPYVFAIVLFLAVLGMYLPGLQNGLVFDDLRLGDGTIFGEYGSLLHFKQRMLSYGSFVWVQDLLGEGWWKQRLVNIAVHMGVVATLYALLKALFVQTRFPEDLEEQAHFTTSRLAALRGARCALQWHCSRPIQWPCTPWATSFKPGVASAHDLDVQGALLQVQAVEVGDFQLAAR